MKKKWIWALAAALLVFTVKNIFVGANTDEAYGITLGYRLVQGDRLLWDMWEPHQTSAIFTALFLRIILFFTGGSLKYLTIFLRICFFLVQLGVTFYSYKSLKVCLPGLSADEHILLSMIYYVTTPKCVFVPEYSNLHVWFSTLLALFLMRYFCRASEDHGKNRFLFLAGVVMACDVLAYPSMILFFPVCILVILLKVEGRREKWKAAGMFLLPCVLGAAIFMGYLFSYMSLDDILTVLPGILGDGSHQLGIGDKMAIWWQGISEILVITIGCGIVAAMGTGLTGRIRKMRRLPEWSAGVVFWVLWFAAQTVVQIACWMHSVYDGSGHPQIAYLMVGVFGILLWHKSGRKTGTGIYLVGFSLLEFIGLNLFSNWKPTLLTVYLVLGILGGILCWRQYFYEKCQDTGIRLIKGICILFLLTEVFGRCFLVLGSEPGNNRIYQIGGICRDSVRAGILVSYMTAYRYNDDAAHFEEIVAPGSKLLYFGPSQYYYMLGDCRVASPTTISTPSHDASLGLYFELHPERFPDVVVLESSYGDIPYFADDDYLFTWIEEVYRPDEIVDYSYVRVFRRNVTDR